MSQSELLKKTIAALEAANTHYMLTGSFASSLQGEPRLTHDIDLVIAITTPGIKSLLAGQRFHVSRPEDTILMKLRWAKLSGGSEKQFGDARSVYEVQEKSLDLPYMERWVKILDLMELWQRLKREAGIGLE